MKAIVSIVLFGLLGAGSAYSGDKDKTPPKMEQKIVDQGTFAIYSGGKRIGTEKFKIEQRADLGIVTAELKVDDGKNQATQTTEMRVAPNGELRSYTWRALSPEAEEAVVEPQNDLLVEHLVLPDQKKKDVQHLLQPNTAILDNNFFSQREVLLWRYLQTGCVWKEGQGRMCGPSSYAVLVPQTHLSSSATLSLLGMGKIMVKGSERMLSKVSLQLGDPKQFVVMSGQSDSNSNEWLLWVDDEYKILKITVTGTNFEVIRE